MGTVYENCFYEPCPQSCQDSVKRGETNEACREYLGDTQCYINGDCPDECQQKALWGECPAACKEYMGNPDCCAPSCPPKCTNRRRGSCEATGVEEWGESLAAARNISTRSLGRESTFPRR